MSKYQNTFYFIKSSHTSKEIEYSLSLVRESFGDTDMAYKDYYEYLFLRNPIGIGRVLFVYFNDLPVGQVASIPCLYKIHDRNSIITLTMNVCVSTNYRGKGLLTRLMHEIHKDSKVPFSIGIPNDKSMKGHLKNNYKPLPLSFLIRPLHLSNYFNNRLIRNIVKLTDIIWKKDNFDVTFYNQEFDKGFDRLFIERFGDEYIVQIRNKEFLNWRYIYNPRRRYFTFVCKDKELINGYIICRIVNIFGLNLGMIMDLVSLDISYAKELIDTALNFFWNNNVTLACTIVAPNNSLEFQALKDRLFKCPNRFKPHPFMLCVKELEEFDYMLDINKWFFMPGDYEVF